MRAELFYNPRLLCERLAEISEQGKRRRSLRGTPAAILELGHLDSLELLQLLSSKAPNVIYDIGAYYGTWTVLAKSIFPEAEIHAFEPLEQLRVPFMERTRGLEKVNYHPVALGSISSEEPMELASFLDASSLLPMTENQMREFKTRRVGTQQVKVEPLDDFVWQNKLPEPDLIKLDVQGYELEVLRGATRCLSKATAIISEVSFAEFYRGQCLFEDVTCFLSKCGFRARAFGAGTKIGVRLLQTDMLFEKVSS